MTNALSVSAWIYPTGTGQAALGIIVCKEGEYEIARFFEALGFLGYVYGVVGKRNKALDVLGELMELRKKRYVQPHNVALVYIGLGEDDSAFEWLDKAFTDRCGPLTYIKVWPFFDRIRSDPRYKELIQRLGLPP